MFVTITIDEAGMTPTGYQEMPSSMKTAHGLISSQALLSQSSRSLEKSVVTHLASTE
jgi:hypothetical protein